MSTDRLAREPWELAGKHPAPRTPPQASIVRMARLPGYPRSPRPARQVIGRRDRRIYFAVIFSYF